MRSAGVDISPDSPLIDMSLCFTSEQTTVLECNRCSSLRLGYVAFRPSSFSGNAKERNPQTGYLEHCP